MLFVKEQTHRLGEQNSESRNRSHICGQLISDKGAKSNSVWKREVFPANCVESSYMTPKT